MSVPDPTLTDWVPLNRIAAPTLSGTLANRPAASTAGLGTLYYTTDTGETYRSDGAAWTLVNRSVPDPVVNGQWVKGSGGAAVWSALAAADVKGGSDGQYLRSTSGAGAFTSIPHTDITSGIRCISGNQYRPEFAGSRLEHWIDSTKLDSMPRDWHWFGPIQTGSGAIAPLTEGSVTYAHGRGTQPLAVFSEFEDGSYAGFCTHRITRDATNIGWNIANNHHTANATVVIRFIYLMASG